MDCRSAHQSIGRGERSVELDAHLATCPPCASLAAGGALVGRALARAGGGDDSLDAVFAGIDTRERGAAGWLRARRSGWRLAAALAVAAAVPLAVLRAAPRADLAAVSPLRFGVSLAILGALVVGLAARALRPLHRADPARWLDEALIAAAALGALMVAFVPVSHSDAHVPLVAGALRCLAFGLATGAPVAALLLLLDRVGSRRTAGEAVVAAAVAGDLALQLHCPVADLRHLLVGHALLVPLVLAGFALSWWSRRAISPG